jgi:radical SAM protein with 4Fe4S-binding SPASM domain
VKDSKYQVKSVRFVQAQSRMARDAIATAPQGEMDARSDSDRYDFDPNESYKEIVYSQDWKQGKSAEYFTYRADWDAIPREKRETDFPLHLDIETTNICNLRCPMCPRTILLAADEFSDLGFMTKSEYQDIIDQAVAAGVKSIKLNYLGEPLSHPDVIWQVAYAKEKGVLDVMMNTNASLLSEETGAELLKAGLDNLFVSFDAIDPEDFATQRTGTTIGKVIDNVYQFTLLRRRLRPSCQIRVSMVMYKDPKWVRQFEAMQAMWSHHVDALGYGYYVERDLHKQIYFPEVPSFHCAQPFQRMFLKYNGNVTICCVDDKDETIVGNWRDTPLQEIWKGDIYRSIRDTHACGRYYDMEMCRKCYMPHSR